MVISELPVSLYPYIVANQVTLITLGGHHPDPVCREGTFHLPQRGMFLGGGISGWALLKMITCSSGTAGWSHLREENHHAQTFLSKCPEMYAEHLNFSRKQTWFLLRVFFLFFNFFILFFFTFLSPISCCCLKSQDCASCTASSCIFHTSLTTPPTNVLITSSKQQKKKMAIISMALGGHRAKPALWKSSSCAWHAFLYIIKYYWFFSWFCHFTTVCPLHIPLFIPIVWS